MTFSIIFFLFVFSWLHLQHMEVPRLGVQSELQLLTYATATEMQDLGLICDLHHSSGQRQIPNQLSKARNQTHDLMVPSQICFWCTMMGTPNINVYLISFFLMVQYFYLSLVERISIFFCEALVLYPLETK